MPTSAEYEYIARFSEPDNPTGFSYVGSNHGRSTTAADTPASTYIAPALDKVPSEAVALLVAEKATDSPERIPPSKPMVAP